MRYIYAIFDKVAHEMGPLFEAKNDDIAERMCKNGLKELVNPREQSLYRLGSIDHDCDQKMSCIAPEFDLVLPDLTSIFPRVSEQEEDLTNAVGGSNE